MQPGYRRRILIESAIGVVTAELEDDYHRMVVSLHHADGLVTRIDSVMKRSPWTECPGAMLQLRKTFEGHRLVDFARRGEKQQNCTHLHDLALFAAAHAEGAPGVAYDVLVTDPVDGVRDAWIARDGVATLSWRLRGDLFLMPEALAGRRLGELGDWIAVQDAAVAEAGRILRWAAIIAYGRAMDIPAGISATVFPAGSCYNFQPERARTSTRRSGADRDLSKAGAQPLADRSQIFRFSASDAA